MKIKNIKEEIKEYFFTNPTVKIRVRPLEKILKLPLPSVIRYCRELEEEGIIKKMKIGNVVFYSADRANNNFLLEKKLYNIKSLYTFGLVDFIKFCLSNPAIILFGSYSKGEDIENSDIDLYIETSSKKDILLSNFENKLRRKIQIFRYKRIKAVKNMHLANNIINGVSLNGFIEVFR
ncbi:MAG: nucleotidyltransferase domain-containing protein [Nanoarchaeota archaeon]